MFIFILALIFIRPFIPSLALPYFNFLYSALFLLSLFLWIIVKKADLSAMHELKYPLVLFSLALFLSFLLSDNKTSGLKDAFNYISGIMLLITASSFDLNNKKNILRIVILAGFIVSLLAIHQYFFGLKHTLDYMHKTEIADPFAISYLTRKRAFFPFITPNILASYLIIVIFLALENKRRLFILPFLFFALLLTKSMGGLLSLFLALMVYFYLKKKVKREKSLLLLM
ncbi:MAG: hypothetical protein JW788_02850, partial [Candidatus Omnitrophica bacterium]|nr:hypothetical protein [Candidatus Omnitrophota bacterium]